MNPVGILRRLGRNRHAGTRLLDQPVSTWPVNARQPHYRRRHTAAQGNIFRSQQGPAGLAVGLGTAVLGDPLTILLGIDTSAGNLQQMAQPTLALPQPIDHMRQPLHVQTLVQLGIAFACCRTKHQIIDLLRPVRRALGSTQVRRNRQYALRQPGDITTHTVNLPATRQQPHRQRRPHIPTSGNDHAPHRFLPFCIRKAPLYQPEADGHTVSKGTSIVLLYQPTGYATAHCLTLFRSQTDCSQ